MDIKLFFQAIIKYIFGVLIIGALLFIPANSFEYWNGWLFMGLLFVPMFIAGININEILFSDRIMVLREGKIKQIFSKEEIFDDISLLEKNNIYIPDFLRLIILLNRSGLNIKIKDYS